VHDSDGNALDLKFVHIDGSVSFLVGVAGVQIIHFLFFNSYIYRYDSSSDKKNIQKCP